jgi:heptosyltransferase II
MRVLVVKLGAIGDAIMSLAVIPVLRAQSPVVHLTWVVGRAAAPVLQLVAGVDEVVTVDERRLFAGRAFDRVGEIVRLWRYLAGRSFDLVITGHSDPRYRLLTIPVLAKVRRRFGTGSRAGPLPGRLHTQEYARLASGQDGPEAPLGRLPPVIRPLPQVPFEWQGNESIVVLAPGGAQNLLRASPLRRWPVEAYRALACILIAKGHRVVIVGGPQDGDVKPHFSDLHSVDLVGRTSLAELAAVFDIAAVVVTHDSLAVHMSRLVRAPVVALFGPTSPLSFGPQNPGETGDAGRVEVIWGGASLPCRPCYDGKEFHACRVNRCMTGITVDEVVAAVEKVIGFRHSRRLPTVGSGQASYVPG